MENRYIYGALVLVLLMVGCSRPASEGEARSANMLSEQQCYQAASDVLFLPLVKGQECGVLAVRENPADNNSRDISLNILRLPAISASPHPDPLFILVGGPGQAAVALAGELNFFNDVRKHRDLIFIDQRGTGKSGAFACHQNSESLPHHETSESLQQKVLAELRACAEKHAAHMPFYTTPFAVADLDAVRRALGYERINLWGVSYGTRVILEYLRRYPEQVRTAVLDGVAPAGMNLLQSFAEDGARSLQLLSEQCLDQSTCAERYGDISNQYEQLLARLAQQPARVTVPHPRTALPETVLVDRQKVEGLMRMAFYTRDLTRLVPWLIHQGATDNFLPLASLLILISEQDPLAIDHGMHYTVICNEDYPLAATGRADSALAALFDEVCSFWPKAELPSDYFAPVVSDVPVLILSGYRDPATPPRWGERVAASLSRSLHLVAPGGHHSVSRDGCIPQLIGRFIQTASPGNLDSRCVENIRAFAPYLAITDPAASQEGALQP